MSFTEADLTHDAFLGGRLHLWQPKAGYRAATDPVLLAASVPAKAGERVLELGCGAGAAVLCLMARVPGLVALGLEVQAEYADLARRNAAEGGFDLTVLEGDVAAPPAALRAENFDHVLMNPPFFETDDASAPTDVGRDRAHRLTGPGLDVWIALGLRRLRPGGRISLIHRSAALGRILSALEGGGAGDIRVLPLAARQGRAAGRVIVQASKGARAPLILLAPLVMHDGAAHGRDGEGFSETVENLLRGGASLPLSGR